MRRFLAGFLSATVVYGLLGFAYLELRGDDSDPPMSADASIADGSMPASPMRQVARRVGSKAGKRAKQPRWDDLDAPSTRTIDPLAAGGEAQLSSAEVEAGMDRIFPQIRRCLILAATDAPPTGRLVFGLRIAGSGDVVGVNLSGPEAVRTGEAGACLERAARDARFSSFDGPPMVVRYPVTLH
ncbi:MAG: hypothetical protein AAGF12_08505 [Myxococcota bacterium]